VSQVRNRPPQRGISLIEVVVFIVVVSAAAVALLGALAGIVPRGSTAAQLTQASQLAQERMELIVGQRAVLGYSSTQLDPCPLLGTQIPCTQLSSFVVTATGINPAVGWPTDTLSNRQSNRQITVTVTGPTGAVLAKEDIVLSNF
jgi:Tfp pilus assembly protein PilV